MKRYNIEIKPMYKEKQQPSFSKMIAHQFTLNIHQNNYQLKHLKRNT